MEKPRSVLVHSFTSSNFAWVCHTMHILYLMIRQVIQALGFVLTFFTNVVLPTVDNHVFGQVKFLSKCFQAYRAPQFTSRMMHSLVLFLLMFLWWLLVLKLFWFDRWWCVLWKVRTSACRHSQVQWFIIPVLFFCDFFSVFFWVCKDPMVHHDDYLQLSLCPCPSFQHGKVSQGLSWSVACSQLLVCRSPIFSASQSPFDWAHIMGHIPDHAFLVPEPGELHTCRCHQGGWGVCNSCLPVSWF